MKEIAQIEGFLTSEKLQKALASGKPGVRAEAEAWKTEAEDRLFALQHNVPNIAQQTGIDYATALKAERIGAAQAGLALAGAVRDKIEPLARRSGPGSAGSMGSATGENYGDGLAGKRTHVLGRSGAGALYTAVVDKLQIARTTVSGWGSSVGSAWAGGIASQRGTLFEKVMHFLGPVIDWLQGHSPPKKGPLREIDRWGTNVMAAYASGIEAGAPAAANVAQRAALRIASAWRNTLAGNAAFSGSFTASPSFAFAGAGGFPGGGLSLVAPSSPSGGSLVIHNHYGKDSIRSDDDIERITRAQSENLRLRGGQIAGSRAANSLESQ
jgi:hypothetical protein